MIIIELLEDYYLSSHITSTRTTFWQTIHHKSFPAAAGASHRHVKLSLWTSIARIELFLAPHGRIVHVRSRDASIIENPGQSLLNSQRGAQDHYNINALGLMHPSDKKNSLVPIPAMDSSFTSSLTTLPRTQEEALKAGKTAWQPPSIAIPTAEEQARVAAELMKELYSPFADSTHVSPYVSPYYRPSARSSSPIDDDASSTIKLPRPMAQPIRGGFMNTHGARPQLGSSKELTFWQPPTKKPVRRPSINFGPTVLELSARGKQETEAESGGARKRTMSEHSDDSSSTVADESWNPVDAYLSSSGDEAIHSQNVASLLDHGATPIPTPTKPGPHDDEAYQSASPEVVNVLSRPIGSLHHALSRNSNDSTSTVASDSWNPISAFLAPSPDKDVPTDSAGLTLVHSNDSTSSSDAESWDPINTYLSTYFTDDKLPAGAVAGLNDRPSSAHSNDSGSTIASDSWNPVATYLSSSSDSEPDLKNAVSLFGYSTRATIDPSRLTQSEIFEHYPRDNICLGGSTDGISVVDTAYATGRAPRTRKEWSAYKLENSEMIDLADYTSDPALLAPFKDGTKFLLTKRDVPDRVLYPFDDDAEGNDPTVPLLPPVAPARSRREKERKRVRFEELDRTFEFPARGDDEEALLGVMENRTLFRRLTDVILGWGKTVWEWLGGWW
jgi:hypothetical protein